MKCPCVVFAWVVPLAVCFEGRGCFEGGWGGACGRRGVGCVEILNERAFRKGRWEGSLENVEPGAVL